MGAIKMQWTKISVKYAEHLLLDASDSVFRSYIRLLLLVTSMELAPNLKQVCSHLGKRKTETLIAYLSEKGITLDMIIAKVMEDVDSVVRKREDGKLRQKKHRSNVLHNAPVTTVDKIREDKYINNQKKDLSINILNKDISIWWEHFLLKTKRKFKFTADKKALIKKRLLEGRTMDEFKIVVDNFVNDKWSGRSDNMNLIYCIGKQRDKPDNFEKWLNMKKGAEKRVYVG